MFIRVASCLAAFFISAGASPVLAAHAVAAAQTATGVAYYWSTNQSSKKAAEHKAMKTCVDNAKKEKHEGKCQVLLSAVGPKYIAFFHAKNGSVGVASSADRQQALSTAYAQCAKEGECPDTAARVDFDEGEQQAQPAKPASAGGDCRPRTKEIRCRWDCSNGDCVVAYENGCMIRVQVSPRYDPFANQWTYPSPSC